MQKKVEFESVVKNNLMTSPKNRLTLVPSIMDTKDTSLQRSHPSESLQCTKEIIFKGISYNLSLNQVQHDLGKTIQLNNNNETMQHKAK